MLIPNFAAMFEKNIEEYEGIRQEYQQKIADKMGEKQWMEYNEILFSAYSCGIEGNSFTVDDTRILREQGMAMIPVGRSLLECTEMADHFRAFDYMVSHLNHPFDEALLKDVNRLVTEHTIAYRAQGAIAGEYTTEDMAAGDTMFGDHEGRLLSNFILLKAGHPLLIIKLEDRSEYISALKQIRTEGTDEYLVAFFFKTAINRMKSEMAQKRKNTLPTMFF